MNKKFIRYIGVIVISIIVIIGILSVDLWIDKVVEFIVFNWPLLLIGLVVLYYLAIEKSGHDESEMSAKVRYENTKKLENQIKDESVIF